MKRYEAYKDSGIQWLGEIPVHWNVCKVKSLFKHISGNGFKVIYQGKENGKYPFCKASDINGEQMFISSAKNYVDDDIAISEGYNIIPEYSILFSKIGEALKKNHRKINTVPCIVDNNCSALVNQSQENIIFFYYVMKVVDMVWFDNAGVIPCVNISKLMSCGLPLPPLAEQEVIVAYLDQKVDKIDAILSEKEAMVEQLQQYRKSLISETVTRGLDSNVPMKDSGIDWIGQIPQHWEISRVKNMVSLITDNVTDQSLPKVGLENIESETGCYIKTDSDFMGTGVEFRNDDILFGKLRPYLAKVYKAEFNGQSVGDIYVFRGKNDQEPDFLKYLFLSNLFIDIVNGSTYGAKMPRANWDFISHLELPNPPKEEQKIIAAFLDKKISIIYASISELQSQIEDLKAYKSAIITEAVTGKVDLRDWKPSEVNA